MTEHVLEWLPAYYDGELSENRRRKVEAHLQECASCLAELESLQGLSALLRSEPAPAHTPPERFTAQVQLLLPRGSGVRQQPQALPRWMLGAPLLLIAGWAFLQAALIVTAFALAAGSFFPGLAGWFATDSALDITEML
jgi:anti-sigma factor RsiW